MVVGLSARYVIVERQCDVCLRRSKPTDSSAISLTPILAFAPFEKRDIDFVAPINSSNRHGQYQYILVATDYVTQWVETEAT